MKKTFLYLFVIAVIIYLASCVGFQPQANVGFGIHGGPCGIGVTPTFNVGVYSGGYGR